MNPTRGRRSLSPRVLTAVRLAYGAALLVEPAELLSALGLRSDGRARTFARLLGGRHLVEALLVTRSGSAASMAGAAVDGGHAVTAAAWAVGDRRHRRALVLNAACASVLAGEAIAARRGRSHPR